MLRRFDRLLIRVSSLPAAVKFWHETYGATIVRQDRGAAMLRLAEGGEVVLHTDEHLAEQEFYLLVDDVRQMHKDRAKLKLEFRTPPTRGTRGYFATVRDPFGTVLQVADLALQAHPHGHPHEHDHGPATTTPAGTETLFGATPPKHKPDRARLGELYGKLGRTADDLPYTTHFETLYDAYAVGFPDPKPDHAEVWRHLLTTRKAGQLPKLGAARSAPPEVGDEDRQRLRDLLGDDIGKRDRLPYQPRFDQLVTAFNAGRRRPYSPHQIWRLVATLAK